MILCFRVSVIIIIDFFFISAENSMVIIGFNKNKYK